MFVAQLLYISLMKLELIIQLPQAPLRDQASPDVSHPKRAVAGEVQQREYLAPPPRILTIEWAPDPAGQRRSLEIIERNFMVEH